MGASLGVALGLSAIAGLFAFLMERKKRKAAEELATQAQASGYGQVNPMGYTSEKWAHEASSQPLHEIDDGRRKP